MRYKKLEIFYEQIYNKVYKIFEKKVQTMTVLKEINIAQDRLCYCLTESVREDGSVTYGVEVTTTLFGAPEVSAVDDISPDRQFAEKFLNMLADNLVLPSTLKEVAEEFVASYFTV